MQPDPTDGTGRPRPHRISEEWVEEVLELVEQIPPGQVLSYGDLAELLESGGPRSVARVMSTQGAGVPWWRVIRADGRPAPQVAERQLDLLAREGVVVRNGRIAMARHRWSPHLP